MEPASLTRRLMWPRRTARLRRDVARGCRSGEERHRSRARRSANYICTGAQTTVVSTGCSRAGFSRAISAPSQFQAACNSPVRSNVVESQSHTGAHAYTHTRIAVVARRSIARARFSRAGDLKPAPTRSIPPNPWVALSLSSRDAATESRLWIFRLSRYDLGRLTNHAN